MLRSHHIILTIPLGALGVEAAANAGATPAHFIAFGSILAAIVAVVKGYDWAEHKVQSVVRAEITLHGAEDQIRFERLKAEVSGLAEQLRHRPCIASKCKHGEHA